MGPYRQSLRFVLCMSKVLLQTFLRTFLRIKLLIGLSKTFNKIIKFILIRKTDIICRQSLYSENPLQLSGDVARFASLRMGENSVNPTTEILPRIYLTLYPNFVYLHMLDNLVRIPGYVNLTGSKTSSVLPPAAPSPCLICIVSAMRSSSSAMD